MATKKSTKVEPVIEPLPVSNSLDTVVELLLALEETLIGSANALDQCRISELYAKLKEARS